MCNSLILWLHHEGRSRIQRDGGPENQNTYWTLHFIGCSNKIKETILISTWWRTNWTAHLVCLLRTKGTFFQSTILLLLIIIIKAPGRCDPLLDSSSIPFLSFYNATGGFECWIWVTSPEGILGVFDTLIKWFECDLFLCVNLQQLFGVVNKWPMGLSFGRKSLFDVVNSEAYCI